MLSAWSVIRESYQVFSIGIMLAADTILTDFQQAHV
jgi:hypothetical protein